MKRNTLIFIVIVLVALAIGYFVINRPSAPPVEETPTDTASQGKLDIQVVCESALAYMTFEDGASADAFIAECKEGKYPEVIERYKEQLNLGDGATI